MALASRSISTLRFLAAIALLAALCGPACAGTVYDLTSDWSDAFNPNGVWCYRQGGALLPHVSAWQGLSGDFTSAQPAWARFDVGTSNLPCFFRSSGTLGIAHDWQSGDVVCHTTDNFNGLGSGTANVLFTSPVTGTVAITGAVWMGRDIGRGNHWNILHNGVSLTSGDVSSGDVYSRASPMSFAAGSGGPGALAAVAVQTGDAIELDLTKTSSPGDYAAIRMTVEVVAPAAVEAGAAPELRLAVPSPNPVRGDSRLGYSLPREGEASLELYDLHGRLVQVLDRGPRATGEHTVAWRARVPSAVYFLRLRSGGTEVTRRIVVGR